MWPNAIVAADKQRLHVGEVDFEEFHTWWLNVGEEKSQWASLLEARDDRRDRELRGAFDAIDADGR